MKKLLAVIAMVLMASPVMAGDNIDGGIKVDAPYLIQINSIQLS